MAIRWWSPMCSTKKHQLPGKPLLNPIVEIFLSQMSIKAFGPIWEATIHHKRKRRHFCSRRQPTTARKRARNERGT
ncbi:hypothetical protein L596_002127 [Steinernema carpocapsae]|uniref:Uncharacterized protein n=1 Tax=Steinernema carpocapsae TaxID=34508 RepID=A0A4U8UNK3_STECR|nr:hypothetical protein L596_002127 [Steinernema carpocapsae]